MADALNELRTMLTDDLPVAPPPRRGPRPAVVGAAVGILVVAALYAYRQQQQQQAPLDPHDADPLFQPF
jgi:hypothetical protein